MSAEGHLQKRISMGHPSLDFASLAASPLARLLCSSKPAQHKPGHVLFLEGDAVLHVFMVIEGIVRLSRSLPNGRRIVGAFVFPGQIIGLSFDDRYPFNAEAVGSVTLCRFNRARLYELGGELADFQIALVDHLRHLLALTREQQILLKMSADGRLAAFIRLVARSGQKTLADGVEIELAMVRADIADYLGISTESAEVL